MARLVVIEDDPSIAESLQLALGRLGHDVSTAGSGELGLAVIERAAVDLAVVDVMLPGMDGFEVCRRVRAAGALPIILLTARGDPIDVVVGLECGADDYVVKPVEPRVLDARIKAVLRRLTEPTAAAPRRPAVVGDLVLDEAAMVVSRADEPIALTPTELRLFVEFVRHPGQVLTRRALLERVWEYGFTGDTRLVDAAVQRLRAKIEADPVHPTLVVTVRGVGYRMDVP